jgi:hypothetical protein
MAEVAINFISGVLGGVFVFISERYFTKPFLKIGEVSGPRLIGAEIIAEEDSSEFSANAYRVELKNTEKFVFGDSAINCKCELSIDNLHEKFWLPWNILETPIKNENKIVNINRGSFAYLDFCARCSDNMGYREGTIIIAQQEWYHNPIRISDGASSLTGTIKITSENRGYLEKKFTIIPIEGNKLQILFK